MALSKIYCIYSNNSKSYNAYTEFKQQNSFVGINDADVILCLGGDGFLLHSIHKYINYDIPIYGMNTGSVGFLLNKLNTEKKLLEQINHATPFVLNPLEAEFTNTKGETFSDIAFNEISFLRSTANATHIKVTVDSVVRLHKLVADGILIATPSGSSAYNRACGGNVVSFNSNLLVLTPINPFRPISWRGTTLASHHTIEIENIDTKKRKFNICFDFKDYFDIQKAVIKLSASKTACLLFDSLDSLENKIIKAQFNNE